MAKPSSANKKAIVVALAAALAIPAEGLRQVAYQDPPGIWTVCMGHTGPDVVRNRVYTVAECKAFMSADMIKAVNIVDRCVPGLPVNVHAAFSDGVFNMGSTIACDTKHSTAARLLAAGDYVAACKQLPLWNKARIAGVLVPLPGLTKRRAADMALCLTPDTPETTQ